MSIFDIRKELKLNEIGAKIALSYTDDCGNYRGKSEHHRAGRQLTAAGGDSRESATEIYRRSRGKDGKAR